MAKVKMLTAVNIKEYTVGDNTEDGKGFHVLYPGPIDVLSVTRDETHALVECQDGALFLLRNEDVEFRGYITV